MKFGSHRTKKQRGGGSKTSSSSREVEWKKKHIKKDFRAQRPIKFRLDHLSESEHKSAAIAAFSHAQNWSRGGRCLHTQIDPQAPQMSIVALGTEHYWQ